MSLTTFRQAVQDALQVGMGITFTAGKQPSALNDRSLG